jgi:hypothetical protein
VLNDAVTERAVAMATWHVSAPLHAPDQPEKTEPAAGVAVRVTTAFAAIDAEHVAPQSMPPMSLVTVPLPVPLLLTVSV